MVSAFELHKVYKFMIFWTRTLKFHKTFQFENLCLPVYRKDAITRPNLGGLSLLLEKRNVLTCWFIIGYVDQIIPF